MISVIITSFKEPKTIGRAIKAFLDQDLEDFEILVLAPDDATLRIARSFSDKRIRTVKDPGKGKPVALNLAFSKAKGDILILSDGDVYVSGSIKDLVSHFKDKSVGAVTGRILSTNPKNEMFGFWAHLLTKGFHDLRTLESRKGENIICSGYLYAIRSSLAKSIPENILADDAFISLSVNKQGYESVYEPNAMAFVKYPTNLPDWIRQKKRTAARFYQLNKYFKISKLRSAKNEVLAGARSLLEANTLSRMLWFIFLIVMRTYIWFRVLFDVRLWKRSFGATWQRVESTK